MACRPQTGSQLSVLVLRVRASEKRSARVSLVQWSSSLQFTTGKEGNPIYVTLQAAYLYFFLKISTICGTVFSALRPKM